jgi:hypothetical protein
MVETSSTNQEKGYWKKPENYIALATLLAVLTYTGVQIWQTNIISTNNVVSQRAFVSFIPSPQPTITGPSTAPTGVNFLANLINSGNTPTKNLSFLYKCAPSGEELQEPWSILYQGKELPEHLPQFIGGHGLIPIVCFFNWEQVEAMAAGKLFGYLMLDAQYSDRLDDKTRHVTQAALLLSQVFTQVQKENAPAANPPSVNPGTSVAFTPTMIQLALTNKGKHNCADEECPPN